MSAQRAGDVMRQAWCSRAGCSGGAKVGVDCPVSMLDCIACGSPLTFVEPHGGVPDASIQTRRPWRDVLGELDTHDPVPAGEMPIDPGIRRFVLILRAEGIDTDQSCQGGPGHACPEPMVRFQGNAYEGFKAFAIAMTYGLPVLDIRHVYSVIDGRLHGPLWEMTFRTADPEITSEPRAVSAEGMAAGA